MSLLEDIQLLKERICNSNLSDKEKVAILEGVKNILLK